jgi:hypothetical protein
MPPVKLEDYIVSSREHREALCVLWDSLKSPVLVFPDPYDATRASQVEVRHLQHKMWLTRSQESPGQWRYDFTDMNRVIGWNYQDGGLEPAPV